MVWKYAAAAAYLCVSERRAAGAAYGLGEGAEPKLSIDAFNFADCVLKVSSMGECMSKWVCAVMRIFHELVSGGKNGSVSFHVLFSESHSYPLGKEQGNLFTMQRLFIIVKEKVGPTGNAYTRGREAHKSGERAKR